MLRILLLAIAQCAVLGSLAAPAVVGLSVMVGRLAGPVDAPAVLSVVGACGSAAALVANPLLGWCADRTPPRFGGRRVWLLAGAALGVCGSWWLVSADDVVALVTAWIFTQSMYNACFGAINGLLSVSLRPEQRTRAAGVFTAAGMLGTIPGLAAAAIFPGDVMRMTLLVPVLAAVAIAVLSPFLSESDSAAPAERRTRDGIRALRTRAFVATFVVRLVFAVELTAGLLYGLYLFQERWGLSEQEAVRLVSVSTAIGAVGLVIASALIAGLRLRRAGTRALLTTAILVLAAAMLGRGLATTVEAFLVATSFAGIAIGIGFTMTRSSVQAQLPPERAALGLGIFNIANTLAPVLAPVAASVLLAAGAVMPFGDRYAGLYLLLVAPMLLCLALVGSVSSAHRRDPSGVVVLEQTM